VTPDFTVDAFGRFEPGHVITHWSDRPRPSTPVLDELIAETWERMLAHARRTGMRLYNGGLVRWIDHRVEGGTLHLEVGPTCYRDFVGTNLYNPQRLRDYGRACFANAIGSTATVLSSDGWILYGRRSDRVAYHAGYLHTFGGALEMIDVAPDRSIDVFAATRRELSEELGLASDEIEAMCCVGLIHDHEIWQPELLFDVRVRLSRDEVASRLGRDRDQEHVAIEYVRDEPDRLVPFILASAPIAPVAVAALCLHGRHRWGEEWWAAARRGLFGPAGMRAASEPSP